MADKLLWCVSAALGLLWVLLLVINFGATIEWYRKRKHVSLLYLIGSLAGGAAILLLPLATWRERLAYLPFAILPDLPLIMGCIWWLFTKRRP